MADQVPKAGSTGGGNLGSDPQPAAPSSVSQSREDTNTGSTSQPAAGATEGRVVSPIRRRDTLPTRRNDPSSFSAEGTTDTTRRRGRTISARPQHLDPRSLSPRSQAFMRDRSDPGGDERMDAIPESRAASPGAGGQRGSMHSAEHRFSSSGLRPRMGTWGANPSPGRPVRRSTVNRRPSVTVAAVATGRAPDAQSANFSLGGPAAVDTIAANQPYVDPGYSSLNPAYDQPVNTRPVWGLAKPLPRVIRPGMVPTRSELKAPDNQRQDEPNLDLEQGRVEPTLRVDKISSQLQTTRQARENRLVQQITRTGAPSLPNIPSVVGKKTSNIGPLSPQSEAIEEEEDLGLAHPSLPPQPSQPSAAQVQPDASHWYPDDASIAATEHEQDGDLDGDWIHDEIPLKAYDQAEDDEIHNLHTHWSVIRLRFREPLAELLAVTVQLTLGFCSDLVVATSNGKAGNEETTDWAWGLATMVGIYIAGGISGAHLNPAISIMLYIYRGFPLRKVPGYVLAQLLGAFLAGLIAFGLFQNDIIAYGGADLGKSGTMSAFITYPRYEWIDASTSFFTEFTGTAILAVAVLALGDDTNAPPGAGMNAFVLGLIITVLSMAFGYNTGAAMNPTRDFGPRLALLAVGYGGEIFRNGYWVYGPWAATISGAIFGAFLYDAAIFVGGESPVNYPRRRIKRAGHKWKNRWGARLRRTRRRIKRDEDVKGNGEKF